MDYLLTDHSCLPVLTVASEQTYEVARYSIFMKTRVRLEKMSHLDSLIGKDVDQVSLMYETLSRMNAILSVYCHFPNKKLFVGQVAWLYQTYYARGFSYEYFPVLFENLQAMFRERFGEDAVSEFDAIFQWLIVRHKAFIQESAKQELDFLQEKMKEEMHFHAFMDRLINHDFSHALLESTKMFDSSQSLLGFYDKIIKQTMYAIGHSWQHGKIEAAQEHVATAIVNQVMAIIFYRALPKQAIVPAAERPRAVIFATANEYHEIGAKMAADILFFKGWDVTFLGSNVPSRDVKAILHQINPSLMGIAVTMSENLLETRNMIAKIREDSLFRSMKIIVGGLAFSAMNDVPTEFAVDAYIPNLASLGEYVDTL